MRNLTLVLIVLVSVVYFSLYFTKGISEDKCEIWAESIVAGHDDFGMHLRGCDEVDSIYKRVYTRCMSLAYEEVNKKTKDRDFYANIGKNGCVLYEDGTWGEE